MSFEHDHPAGIAPNATTASIEAEKHGDEEDIVYMGHLKFSIIFVALCLSVFQVALVSSACHYPERSNADITDVGVQRTRSSLRPYVYSSIPM